MKNTQTGETKVQLQTALEDLKMETNGVESISAILGKYQAKGAMAESAQIANKVLGISIDEMAWDWSSDLESDDELFYDDSNGIHSETLVFVEDEVAEFGNVVTMFGGIGMAAEETVTEAELDSRVQPSDPTRTLIRKLMGEVADIRTDISMLGAKADNIMEIVDDLLKASILK